MIIHGGFKLYPSVIEGVILENKSIDKCCVIAIPSKEYGSNPEAHIVLKDALKNTDVETLKNIREELVKLCKEKLPEYSQPYGFIFTEELPLTTVGKIDYKKLEKTRTKKLLESQK